MKLDMKNAFNFVRRDHVSQTCLERTPMITKLAFLTYSKSSSVTASGHSIISSSDVQQGHPIGSLLFALAMDQITIGVENFLLDHCTYVHGLALLFESCPYYYYSLAYLTGVVFSSTTAM